MSGDYAIIRRALTYYADALGTPSGNLARDGLKALDCIEEGEPDSAETDTPTPRVVTVTSDGVNPMIYDVPTGVSFLMEICGPDHDDCWTTEMVGPYTGELPDRNSE